jgi:hypothetical protein
VFALSGLAKATFNLHQREWSARLWGAVFGMREAKGIQVSDQENQADERFTLQLRASLGEEAFEREWAAGRAMTWEEAVAFALEENAT